MKLPSAAKRVLVPTLCMLIVLQAIVAFSAVPWVRSDAPHYLLLARNLDQGLFGWVTAQGFEAEALRPPGYPVFLWITLYKLRLSVAGVVGLQLTLYLGCVAALALHLRNHAHASVLLLLISAAYIFPALYVSAVMAEGIAMACVTAVAVIIGTKADSAMRWSSAAAIAALGALFRPDLVLLPILLVLIVAWQTSRGHGVLAGTKAALAPLLASAAILLPYSAWNYAQFGKLTPVPVAGAVGSSLYLATWQGKVPLEDLNALYEKRATPKAVEAGLIADVSRLNRSLGAHPLTAPWLSTEYNSQTIQRRSVEVFFNAAVDRIRDDPLHYAKHVSKNVWWLWNTREYPSLPPPFVFVLKLISSGVAFLGLTGAVITIVKPAGWPLLRREAAVLAYLPAVHIWLHTEARYTAPVRPLLVMFAAVFSAWLWQRWQQNR